MLPEFDVITGPARKVLPVEFPSEQGPVIRKFILSEHTPVELMEYYRRQQQATLAAVEQLKPQLGKQGCVGVATDLFIDLATPILVDVLKEPADSLPAPTTEDLMKLTVRQRQSILAAQDKISLLDEVLGNGIDLLDKARKAKDSTTPS